jgi:hypothetical protein
LHFHALQGVISNQVDSTDLERPVFLELAGSGICSVSIIGLGGVFTNDADHKSTRLCARKVAKVWPPRQTGAKSEPNSGLRHAEVKLIRLPGDVTIHWRQARKPGLPGPRTVRRSRKPRALTAR